MSNRMRREKEENREGREGGERGRGVCKVERIDHSN